MGKDDKEPPPKDLPPKDLPPKDPHPKDPPTRDPLKESETADLKLRINLLRRKCQYAASEIESINDKGHQASLQSDHVASFKGMFRALEKFQNQYEESYLELCALSDTHKSRFTFPSSNDIALKTNVRHWYYEANSNFEELSNAASKSLPSTSMVDANSTIVYGDISQSLPKLDLPKFSGDLVAWTKFRDTFLSLVERATPPMPTMRKYHYLKLSLMGPAAAIISHLPMDDDNYPRAWQAVMEAYDNKRRLATAYLNQILSFKPLQGKASPQTLQSFLMKINDSVSAFNLLKLEDSTSFILFHLAVRCLDSHTREKFELAHKNIPFPKFENLVKFIQDQYNAMMLSGNIDKLESNFQPREPRFKNKKPLFHKNSQPSLITNAKENSNFSSKANSMTPRPVCFICKSGSHPLLSCKSFMDLPLLQRIERVKGFTGCINCFSSQHQVETCGSKWVCRWCKLKHNSSICPGSLGDSSNNPPSAGSLLLAPSGGTTLSSTAIQQTQILLATAIVEIQDGRGHYQSARLVIDCASHYSFITQRLLNKLGLHATSCQKRISGIGQTMFEGSKGQVNCSIRPRNLAAPNLATTALVVKDITTFLPTVSLPYQLWSKYLSFPLADPKFFESGPVDFLLGADLFAEIWTGSAITIEECLPKVFPTVFGHVVVGKYSSPTLSDGTTLLALVEQDDLLADLRKFWETEEPKRTFVPNPDDIICEDHFSSTHYRNEDGSFVVKLPFKCAPPDLSDISTTARRRFLNLEEKLKRQPFVKEKYHDFMLDYINLGHMSTCNSPSNVKYVIPHHSVVKEDRNKLKLRVVFDASAKTSSGSLNDYLLTGPKLQNDIRDILLLFRSRPIVFVADIVHFFRSIWIDKADQHYQCILWRFSPTDAVEMYQLRTLTYGMSCSPYLACAVIRELCRTSGADFPLASAALLRDTYIDDTTTGAETISEALELQDQLITLLEKGQFKLSKWASNSPKLLEKFSGAHETDPINLTSKEDVTLKILGLQWDSTTDCFLYKISRPSQIVSKRSILSAVSRIYDPLGLVSPYVISLKSFIQELWKIGLDWDSALPVTLEYQWETAIKDIETIGRIRIPRFVCIEKPYTYQIVGFCDASETAYAAAIYLRIIKESEVRVQLLTAKTKLAPLKQLTIPRLELSGAYLLTELFTSISGFTSQLDQHCLNPCFFTDSSIVLSWLHTPSYQLKTYAANRVNMIIDKTPPSSWRHVESRQNPADVASRGLSPDELLNHKEWWTGPTWLAYPEHEWPSSSISLLKTAELPEVKLNAVLLIASQSEHIQKFRSFIAQFSSYLKLLRVVALLLRIAKRAQRLPTHSGPLLYSELNEALIRTVKFVQLHYFFNGDISQTSSTMARFVRLNPFVDSRGVLRAGGRLHNANLPYNHRHPILLPSNCHFTEIMVDHFHRTCLHPGPSLLQAVIQTRFWVPSLRRMVQKRTFLCKICYEFSVKTKKPIVPMMANLPESRLLGIRAFLKVGCDFMGPLNLRESMRRKAAISKVYVCLFICMATKAIHLELVSALSANAFLAAFDRFISRRGLPTDLYSDNGTNFVSANSQLKELWHWYNETNTQVKITEYIAHKGIQWHFNPPRSPHFGGLWEAGVKSTKRLFRKAAGDSALTYEELLTLIARIEAVLNSRPLCPLSSDPAECEYLSPGHFLIGCSLLAPPEPSVLDIQLNRLDRWQLIKRMVHYFWQRWRVEYLSTLQNRVKWTKDIPNLKIDDLVIMKEDNIPPLHWPTARIEAVHPGKDGKVRVATVRTPTSIYKRPVKNLIPLLPLSSHPYSESS